MNPDPAATSDDLPGMWDRSDFEYGATDAEEEAALVKATGRCGMTRDSAAELGSVSQPLSGNATLPTSARADFETLLVEEGERPFVMAYSSPIERVFREIDAYDRATGIPIRPWVIGECCDHIYPTCPAVVRTGRLDANDKKWWLGRYETVDDPNNMLCDGHRARGDAVTTVRVHLADAPTDVLVWLVEQPKHLWWTVDQIVTAVAPPDADHALPTVTSALSLLRQMGYVVRSSEIPAWAATVDGQNAVTKAVTASQPNPT